MSPVPSRGKWSLTGQTEEEFSNKKRAVKQGDSPARRMLFLNFKRYVEGHTCKKLHLLSLPWCLFNEELAQPWSHCDSQATISHVCICKPTWAVPERHLGWIFLLSASGKVQMPQRQTVGPAVEERRFWHLSLRVGLSPGLLLSWGMICPWVLYNKDATQPPEQDLFVLLLFRFFSYSCSWLVYVDFKWTVSGTFWHHL